MYYDNASHWGHWSRLLPEEYRWPEPDETSDKILKMFSVDDISLGTLKEYVLKNDTKVTEEKENLYIKVENTLENNQDGTLMIFKREKPEPSKAE